MKRTLIAAAVFVAASGSAFAAAPKAYLFNTTLVGDAVGVEGLVGLYGCVHVSSTAGAVINNNQSVNVNATLNPQAQTYTKGAVTTGYNNSTNSVKSTGSVSVSTMQNHASRSSSSGSIEASGGYAYGTQAGTVADSSYENSSQAGSVATSLTHTGSSSGGHIAAGAVIGGGYAYQQGHNTPTHGSGSAVASAGIAAGYNESGYSNTSGLAASSQGSESSGQGKSYSFTGSEGSGFGAIGGQESTRSDSHTSSADSYRARWSIDAGLTTTNETTQGSVTQYTNSQAPGTLTATTGNNAANGVSGNLGINISEGISNAQSNEVSLASVDVGDVFGNAQIFSTQSSAGTAKINNFNLNASIGEGSLSGVSGNVGVNVASGIGNVQNNSLAGAVTTVNPVNAQTTAMVATDDNSQAAGMTVKGQFQGTAMLGANSLYNASGNIGVNIAGGAGNLQHNGLAIAALNSGK
jgi:hypothetical protein